MRRREFLGVVGGAAASWPLSAHAQQATRASRIGWLSTGSPTSHRLSLAAFREGLRALGYIEGINLAIEYRWAEGNLARLTRIGQSTGPAPGRGHSGGRLDRCAGRQGRNIRHSNYSGGYGRPLGAWAGHEFGSTDWQFDRIYHSGSRNRRKTAPDYDGDCTAGEACGDAGGSRSHEFRTRT